MTDADELPLRNCRLLVVEDDYLVAIDMARALEDCGAEIAGMAASVEEAQATIEAEGDRLNSAVLDVNLGNERVYPVADALLARKIPFVFATGYDAWVIPTAYAAVPRCEKPIRASVIARLLTQQMS